jgi:hypothetical protein
MLKDQAGLCKHESNILNKYTSQIFYLVLLLCNQCRPSTCLPRCLEFGLAESLHGPRSSALANSSIVLGRQRQRLVDLGGEFGRCFGVIT